MSSGRYPQQGATSGSGITGAPGGVAIPEVYASDPRVAPGLARPLMWTVAPAAGTTGYMKTGTADTDWVKFPQTTLHTVSVDATSHTISDLNGDLDGDYDLTGYVLFPTSSTINGLTIEPNTLSTNQRALVSGTAPAANVVPSSVASIMIESFTTAGSGTPFVRFRAKITALTTRVRLYECRGHTDTGTAFRRISCDGVWTDTSTNITSLRIISTLADSIKAGSWFTLTRTGRHT